MFGEDSVDDVGGSLLIAVDFVSVDVISRHGIAVTHDQLQHGGGKVFVRHADKCMSQFVNGRRDSVLRCVGVPSTVKVVWVGAVTIGVGEKPKDWDLKDYVLGHFPAEEEPLMREALTDAAKACELFVNDEISAAMNLFNKKKKQENNESVSGTVTGNQ
jgi:peptidyl-tRNA hydrolase